MQAKYLHSRSCNPRVTKIFCCKWSEDDRIAVVTEKGTNIFEIAHALDQPSPMLNLNRSSFYPSERFPVELYTNKIIPDIFNWKKDDVFYFLMRDMYLPDFPKTTKMVPEISDIFWSPKNLVKPSKCLIAILSTAGAFELAVQVDRSWISIFEFTTPWNEMVAKEEETNQNGNNSDPEQLKKLLDRLLTTTATWSNVHKKSDESVFAYLVTAYRNGEIGIWLVPQISHEMINLELQLDVKLRFKMKLIEHNIKISSLLWLDLDQFNYLLIVGLFNGQISVLKLQEVDEELHFVSYITCYEDADNIPVDFLDVIQKTEEKVEISVIKGMHLLQITIDGSGSLISMKFFTSPGFPITGACVINPDLILLITQDGSLCFVEKSENKEELNCKTIISDIPKNKLQYLGLGYSSNKILFTVITSPSVMYDHLVNREPTTLYFFSLENGLDPCDVILKEQSMSNCWDCLEVIKAKILKFNNSPESISRFTKDLGSLSINELRAAYWIMLILRTHQKKNATDNFIKPLFEVEQAKSYIFLHCASNRLKYLSKVQNLSEEQKLSMSLLRNHLDIWFAGEEEDEEDEDEGSKTPLFLNVKETLEVTKSFDLFEHEKCNLCSATISEPWALECSNGHKLPRCAYTCLQITSAKYRTCTVCQEMFHPSLDEEIDEVHCLYCDLPVIYKVRISDDLLFFTPKNISRPKIANTHKEKESKEDVNVGET